MKLSKIWAGVALVSSLFAANVNAQQSTFVAGKDYEVTAPKGSSEPMVEEFFNYACGACYAAEKFISDFKSNNPNIKFQAIPLELNPAWAIYVKAYYIGEKLGVLDQSHAKIYHRIHVQKKFFKDEDDMRTFFLGLGVEEAAYDGVAKSYWLNTKMRMSKQYAFKNKIMSTPTFLVNKRYRINSSSIGSYEKIEQAMVELSGADK